MKSPCTHLRGRASSVLPVRWLRAFIRSQEAAARLTRGGGGGGGEGVIARARTPFTWWWWRYLSAQLPAPPPHPTQPENNTASEVLAGPHCLSGWLGNLAVSRITGWKFHLHFHEQKYFSVYSVCIFFTQLTRVSCSLFQVLLPEVESSKLHFYKCLG